MQPTEHYIQILGVLFTAINNKNMIKAVIFDVGNVLVKDQPASWYIAKSLGVKTHRVWRILEPVIDDYVGGKLSKEEFWKKLLTELGMKSSRKEEKRYEKIILKIYLKDENRKTNHAMLRILRKLRKKKYKVAILSNVVPEAAIFRRKIKFMKLFKHQYFSSEIQAYKPQKKAYFLVVKKLGVKPQECIFIDNNLKFIQVAKQIGMNTIFYKNPKQVESALKKLKLF
jgi:epoxide hydrolase-like predicted phosphatase